MTEKERAEWQPTVSFQVFALFNATKGRESGECVCIDTGNKKSS